MANFQVLCENHCLGSGYLVQYENFIAALTGFPMSILNTLFGKSDDDSSAPPPKYAYNVTIPHPVGRREAKDLLYKLSSDIKENSTRANHAHDYWENRRGHLKGIGIIGAGVGMLLAPPLVIPALAVTFATMANNQLQHWKHNGFTKKNGQSNWVLDGLSAANKRYNFIGECFQESVEATQKRLEKTQQELNIHDGRGNYNFAFNETMTRLETHRELMQERYKTNEYWNSSLLGVGKERLEIEEDQVTTFKNNIEDMAHGVQKDGGLYFFNRARRAGKAFAAKKNC